MEYLGHTGGADFMQAGDAIFIFIFGRWVRFCGLLEWFETLPGRVLRRLLYGGRIIHLAHA